MFLAKSLRVSLCIVVAPQITPFTFGDEEAFNVGDFVSAQCSVMKGDSPLVIRWAFQSRPLSPSPTGLTVNGLGERLSVLSIQSLSAVHNGEYTCTAENGAGRTNYTASLTVNGLSCISPVFHLLNPKSIESSQGNAPRLAQYN